MRIIAVGVGGFGTSWRAGLAAHPEVEVVALVDIDGDRLAEGARHFSVPESRCFLGDQLPWEGVEADAILHSAPQRVRSDHALRALRAGKHVLSVKPMSDWYETGLAMVHEAARCGRKLVIAHQMRWHPLILKLRELVQSGALGKIGYVHEDFFYTRQGYRGSCPMTHPLLVQGCIHHFDFLRYVLGVDARYVWATSFNPPWIPDPEFRSVYATFEMANGVHACYRSVPSRADHMSWLTEWRIEGTEAVLEVKRDCIYLNGEELLSTWEDGEAFNNRRLPALQQRVLEEFLAYVAGGPEPHISGRNNLPSLAMVFGAIRASETRECQEIAEWPLG